MKISNKPEVQKLIIESLENGNQIKKSCKAAGISYNTYLDWTESESPRYDLDFSNSVKKALLSGKESLREICESVILKAATDKDRPIWQAAAWLLERRFPEYSLKQNIDHTTKGNEINKPLDLSKLTDDEVRTMAEIQKKLND